MGNRSSSHHPPPLAWSHGQYPAYAAPSGAYDAKRGHNGPPAAYTEPYMPHPILCRSMISLSADSGYMTSPSDSERMRLSKGSRMSLNHTDFVEQQRPLIFPPDLKTIKKLEKMEKKQQKLLKKYGGRPLAPPLPPAVFFQSQLMPPPPPPLYSRTMSFDDLHRYFLLSVLLCFAHQLR
ncbi:hypothetical protein KIN20_032953 [Parelaphostrongylus tenuis]|uniref:Uncharacterized protein n=1 Tax=Parelaphostrongylus tenuis TaxID=148309 RepID=A0AAD5R7C0_PARTN|nr:hypothetical protein KIN20_032953 [Parelaphostrongylus tenuis]